MADVVVKEALSWRSDVRRIRSDEALSELNYPDWLVLAFINYESDGDPTAVNGSHVGLLQVKESNAKDTGRTTDQLDGRVTPPRQAGRESILHFFQYMEKYRDFRPRGFTRRVGHRYDPELMAVLWKGGPGLLREYVFALEDEGRDAASGVLRAEGERWLAYRDEILSLMGQVRGAPVPEATGDRRTPSGKIPPFSAAASRPGCASVTAAREQGVPAADSALASSVRTLGRAFGLGAYFDPIAEHLENRPNAEAAMSAARGVVRQARVKGFLGRSTTARRRTITINLPDVTTFFVKPLDTFKFRDGFGLDRPGGRTHLGIDFETRTAAQVEANQGTDPKRGVLGRKPCHSIADGVVLVAATQRGFGRVIYVNHGGGITSRYAHLSEFKVSEGDAVTKGQVIGITGTSETKKDGTFTETGVTIPHLHFELRVNVNVMEGRRPSRNLEANDANVAIDPIPILQNAPYPGEAVERKSQQSRLLSQARMAIGNLLATATTDYATLESGRAYDQICAQQRCQTVAEMGRGDHWDEQARAAPVQQTTLEKDVALPDAAFTRYGPTAIE